MNGLLAMITYCSNPVLLQIFAANNTVKVVNLVGFQESHEFPCCPYPRMYRKRQLFLSFFNASSLRHSMDSTEIPLSIFQRRIHHEV